jgi:hypothetical protein
VDEPISRQWDGWRRVFCDGVCDWPPVLPPTQYRAGAYDSGLSLEEVQEAGLAQRILGRLDVLGTRWRTGWANFGDIMIFLNADGGRHVRRPVRSVRSRMRRSSALVSLVAAASLPVGLAGVAPASACLLPDCGAVDEAGNFAGSAQELANAWLAGIRDSGDNVPSHVDADSAACIATAVRRDSGTWGCSGYGLTEQFPTDDTDDPRVVYTNSLTGVSVDLTGLSNSAAQAAVDSLAVVPVEGEEVVPAATGVQETADSVPVEEPVAPALDVSDQSKDSAVTATDAAVDGVVPPMSGAQYVIDKFHAKNSEYIYWQINGRKGATRFTFTVGLHWHSANVDMRWRETSGAPIIFNWRLRTRHDINNASDETTFTYPDSYGPSGYTTYGGAYEDRYGDGYNTLPYQYNWKMFFNAYNISVRYAGTYLGIWGSVQSDRFYCYKTVSCKYY